MRRRHVGGQISVKVGSTGGGELVLFNKSLF